MAVYDAKLMIDDGMFDRYIRNDERFDDDRRLINVFMSDMTVPRIPVWLES